MFDVIQAELPFLLPSQWGSARRVLRSYNPGQKAWGKWWNIRDSCNFWLSWIAFNVACGLRRGVGHIRLQKPHNSKFWNFFEISPMNRLFTASGSRGTKLPYCFCCPSTFLALQHSRQTDSRLRKQRTDLSSVSNWFKQISQASWPIVSEWCDVISMEFLYVVYHSSLNYQLLFGKWAHAPSLNRQQNAWVCYCQ